MPGKEAGKSSKKLGRAARYTVRNKGQYAHHIAVARARHVKNALRSCGEKFAEQLRDYYSRHPINSIGKRAGKHRGTNE